jgi:hypothetical protein
VFLANSVDRSACASQTLSFALNITSGAELNAEGMKSVLTEYRDAYTFGDISTGTLPTSYSGSSNAVLIDSSSVLKRGTATATVKTFGSANKCEVYIKTSYAGEISSESKYFQEYLTLGDKWTSPEMNTYIETVGVSAKENATKMMALFMEMQLGLANGGVTDDSTSENTVKLVNCNKVSEALCSEATLDIQNNQEVIYLDAEQNTVYFLGQTEQKLIELIQLTNATINGGENGKLVVDQTYGFVKKKSHNAIITTNDAASINSMENGDLTVKENLIKLFHGDTEIELYWGNFTANPTFIMSLCVDNKTADDGQFTSETCLALVNKLKSKFGQDMEVPEYGIGWNESGTYYFYATNADTLKSLIYAMTQDVEQIKNNDVPIPGGDATCGDGVCIDDATENCGNCEADCSCGDIYICRQSRCIPI